MVICIVRVQKTGEFHIVRRGKDLDRLLSKRTQDLRGGADALNGIGAAQDFVDAAQDGDRGSIVRGVQHALQRADLHDKIALSRPDIVPERHGCIDPVAAALIAGSRHCVDRLRKKRCQRGGFKKRRLSGRVGTGQKDRAVCLDAVGNRLTQERMDKISGLKAAARQIRHAIDRKALPPGRDADVS